MTNPVVEKAPAVSTPPRCFFYDCELFEDGAKVALLSIGMVDEEGAEFYAINADADWDRVVENAWLVEHVLPGLPGRVVRDDQGRPVYFALEREHPAVCDSVTIREGLLGFIRAGRAAPRTEDTQLWACYGAYDHVALAQLWGPMPALPVEIPRRTCDVMQLADELALPSRLLPKQGAGEHHALMDARYTRTLYRFLRNVQAQRPATGAGVATYGASRNRRAL